MPSKPAAAKTCYFLAIAQIHAATAAPVIYELIDELTEIGASEDNDIVLSNPDIAPHHLTVRFADGLHHLLVDLAESRRLRDQAWNKYRSGDVYWCPRHGRFKRLDQRGWCSACSRRRGSLWLLRPLKPGDAFDIGASFQATYLVQARAQPSEHAAITSPALAKFKSPIRIARDNLIDGHPEIPVRLLPTDDSNLWRWQPADSPFPIFMHHRVNLAITQHARQNSEREVGGFMLGEVCRDEHAQLFVVVTHALQAEFAEETRGHITFTHKTWLGIHSLHEAHHPDKLIVGWYHTHPGWSIFLSQQDLFIHQSYFKQPWQVALVIDPSIDRAGFFVWKNNQISNPQTPIEPFRLAEIDNWTAAARPRVRIKLTENAKAT
jgi:proteasome lid subunit RPN8/RPN11